MSRMKSDFVHSTGKPISDEWMSKIFESLEMIFGEAKFEKAFPERNTFAKLEKDRTVWKNVLFGCSYEEIKEALRKLKVTVQNHPRAFIPNHLEFYRICKGISIPYGYSTTIGKSDIQEKNLVDQEFDRQKRVSQEIRQKERNEMRMRNKSIASIGMLHFKK